jgi:WD40 repeat protein
MGSQFVFPSIPGQARGKLRARSLFKVDADHLQSQSAVTKIIWQTGTPFFISSSIDQTIKKWDSRTGNCVKTWKGHQEGILDMALSSDGQLIVSGSDDGNALVFACEQVPA